MKLSAFAALLLLACVTPARAQPISPPAPGVPATTGWSTLFTAPDNSRPRSQAHPAQLANVSIRAIVGGGSDAVIAGAVVRGAGTLPVLVRAVGPGLRPFGVTAPLRDPILELFRATSSITRVASAEFGADRTSAYVGAFPLSPTSAIGTGDAAVVGQTVAGTFTAHCRSASNASGVALLEFYDASEKPTPSGARFVNFSSRARVGPDDGTVIVGFVVAGEGEVQLLLRGVGPTLAGLGVTGTLADPAIELFAGNTRLAANDNWNAAGPVATAALQAAARAAGTFDLASGADAALLVTLRAGSYSLHVRGGAGQSGIALAEIYEVTPAAGTFSVGYAVNAFGLDLYRRILPTLTAPNAALSPYSIQSALALTYTGARDTTRTEMARALSYPDSDAALRTGFAEIRTALADAAARSVPLAERASTPTRRIEPLTWQAANRLFGQADFPFRPEFVAQLRDGYAAPLEILDFVADPDAARLHINTWVADQTKQRILDLLPLRSLDRLTRLVLVNALHLKAPWTDPFELRNTTPQPFHLSPGNSRPVPTMSATRSLGYVTEEGMKVLSLDYLGGDLHFLVILPDEGQSPASIATRLTADHFARWSSLGVTDRRTVELFLPSFKIADATLDLTGNLRATMPTPFSKFEANFDGIVPLTQIQPENIYISSVFHKAFVDVNEAGTEAAAATAVVITITTSATIGAPPVIRIDRPFLFAIQHRATATCLFLGHVSDPR
jgi:serpin B